MSEQLKNTVRINKSALTQSDSSNTNVWSEPIESIEFELVSTASLKKLLTTDEDTRRKLETVAAEATGTPGVLAHNVDNDRYEIVDAQGSDEFSLVSTQMLTHMLKSDAQPATDADLLPDDPNSGFDPYNSD